MNRDVCEHFNPLDLPCDKCKGGHMTTLREAAQQALEALVIGSDAAHEVAQNYHEAMAGYRPARHIAVDDDVRKIEAAITALRAALAEPVQEPVAWLAPRTVDSYSRPDLGYETCSKTDYGAFPVYTALPQRKPLTEEELDALAIDEDGLPNSHIEFARAIERAHGIGGQP